MSKSVNVIHLHVLNLVCLILLAFLLLPQRFWRATGCVASYILLCNSGSDAAERKSIESPSFWNGASVTFSHGVICSPNNKNINFKNNCPNKYFLYISYIGDSLESSVSIEFLWVQLVYEKIFSDFSSRNDAWKSSPVFLVLWVLWSFRSSCGITECLISWSSR